MFSAVFLTLGCVWSTALFRVLQKAAVRSECCPYLLGMYVSFGSCALLLPFVDWNQVFGLSLHSFAVLALIGVLYFVIDFLDMVALRDMDAGASNLFGAFGLIFAVTYGVLVLGDDFKFISLAGVLMIIASGLLLSLRFAINSKRALTYKMLATFLLFASSLTEKEITSSVDASTICLVGLFVSGVLFGLRYVQSPGPQLYLRTRQDWLIVLLPLTSIGSLYLWVSALASGQYTLCCCLIQLTVVATFAAEAIFLRSREQLGQQGLASACCISGALAVILS